MLAFATDHFEVPLPTDHRFPMTKYRILRELVQLSSSVEIERATPACQSQLLRVHTQDYVERVVQGNLEHHELRRLGLPWSPALVQRSLASVGATIAACRTALAHGVAASLAGGTHHAFPHRCEGFCVFNDVAVALRELLHEGAIERALIVDLDVHQGNGSAFIFKDEPRVFTLSLHGRKNFPFHKEASDLDVELEDGTDDETYLALLAGALNRLGDFDPQLVVYLAGADPWAGDRLGRLNLSARGLLERDRAVKSWCESRALPLALTMAGGYAPEARDIATLQARTVLLFSGHEEEEIDRLLPAPVA